MRPMSNTRQSINNVRAFAVTALIAIFGGGFSMPAFATLDQNESSVAKDMTHFKSGIRRQLPVAGINSASHVHENKIDDNTVRQ